MKNIRSIFFLLKKDFVDLTGIWFYNVGKLPIGTHLEYFLKYKTSCDFGYVFAVGANIGQFSNKIRLFFPKSEIFLFEPVNSTFKILESKIKGNRLQLFNFGFGDKEEKMEIFINGQVGFS